MALPLFLIVFGAGSGIVGAVETFQGGQKMRDAKKMEKSSHQRLEESLRKQSKKSDLTCKVMDELGKCEMEILKSFQEFSDIVEKIHNRPEFTTYETEGISIPKLDMEDLKDVSIGAGLLLGGLGGAALGTAGGFAAAGATTAAVQALGTASTGVAISSLSGVALTNATYAALGGGAVAAGGGGMALGATVLEVSTAGIGFMIGGILFRAVSAKVFNSAKELYEQVEKEVPTINKICYFLDTLKKNAEDYKKALDKVDDLYKKYMQRFSYIVNDMGKNDWSDFTENEKNIAQNTFLLVGVLNKMCQIALTLQAQDKEELNKVNKKEIKEMVDCSEKIIAELA